LKEIKGLYEERDKLGQQSQALAQELESLRSQFVSSEKDREARGRVIEEQGKRVGELEAEISRRLRELQRLNEDRDARGKVIEEQGTEIKNLKEAASSVEKIICRCQELFEKIRIILIFANPLVYGVSKPLIRALAKYFEEARSHLRAPRNN